MIIIIFNVYAIRNLVLIGRWTLTKTLSTLSLEEAFSVQEGSLADNNHSFQSEKSEICNAKW